MTREYYYLVTRHSKEMSHKINISIETKGQWLPITVNQDKIILDGHERFIDCRKNGLAPEYNIKKFASKIEEMLFVMESNQLRRQLSDYDQIMLGKKIALLEIKLEKLEKKGHKTKAKSLTSSKDKSNPVKNKQPKKDKQGRLRERIRKHVPFGDKTISRALYIESHAPKDQIQKLSSGNKKINTVYNLEKSKQIFKERKNIPIPKGKWNFWIWDPAWPYRRLSTGGSQTGGQAVHYPSETIEDMCRKNIVEHCTDDAIIAIYTTFPFLEETFRIMHAAGFKYRESGYVWIKSDDEPQPDIPFKPGILGMGTDFRVQAELILFGERGNVPSFQMQIPNLHCSRVKSSNGDSIHSKKPEYFRKLFDEIAEKIFPNPAKIELNAVPKNKNQSGVWKEQDWTCVGNGVHVS